MPRKTRQLRATTSTGRRHRRAPKPTQWSRVNGSGQEASKNGSMAAITDTSGLRRSRCRFSTSTASAAV
ncbi:MAG: hypothetical protein E2O76_02400 [Caldithrix sp.]|nr:MAG: hypothetical protein E2O76_02400 [Caldithrix sp.]